MSNADNLLTAAAIRKHYRMGRSVVPVLTSCDLSVRRGEFLMIMGRSGSGKSTLLHLLGALDTPDSGRISLTAGPQSPEVSVFPATERERNEMRRRWFGFVFQFYHLLPELSVLENVLMTRMVGTSISGWFAGRGAIRRDAIALLEQIGLGARLKHRPAELSGGERQRVAFARALVHKPLLLLADEPTGNLDAESGAKIMALLHDLHRSGQTIVMVTHDMQLTKSADRMLVLENGALQT